MGRGLRIARIFGIDIAIHPSWLIIFLVMAWSLAGQVFPASYPQWTPTTTWIVAIVSALLLFVSVLVHELAHSLVAKAQGIPVRDITLFLLGGVSTIEAEASSPGRETLMAGAGPASSLVIGVLCLLPARAMSGDSVGQAILAYLGFINIALAIFNLLPGFPLDGGRVLRSILWALTHDFLKATRWAARTGTVFGYLLIVAAVVVGVRTGDLLGAVWTGFVGWVLVQASQAAYQQSHTESRLAGVPVHRLMSRPTGWIPGDITLRRAADDYFLSTSSRCLPVQDDYGHLEGLVCVADLQRADQTQWGVEQVQDVMTPLDRLQTVDPDEPASVAFHRLVTTDVNQLAVVRDGRLLGFVDRASVMRFMQVAHHGGPDGRPARDERSAPGGPASGEPGRLASGETAAVTPTPTDPGGGASSDPDDQGRRTTTTAMSSSRVPPA